MSEHQVVACAIRAICVLLVVLIISFTTFFIYRERLIAQAISNGVDPIEASLALTRPYMSDIITYR